MPRRLRRAQQIYQVDHNTDNNAEDGFLSTGAAAGLLDNALESNLEYNNGHRKLPKADDKMIVAKYEKQKSTKEAKADKATKGYGGEKGGKSEKATKNKKMESTKDMKNDKSSGTALAKKQVRQAPNMESVAMDGMSSMSMDMSMEMHEVELMMGSMSM